MAVGLYSMDDSRESSESELEAERSVLSLEAPEPIRLFLAGKASSVATDPALCGEDSSCCEASSTIGYFEFLGPRLTLAFHVPNPSQKQLSHLQGYSSCFFEMTAAGFVSC